MIGIYHNYWDRLTEKLAKIVIVAILGLLIGCVDDYSYYHVKIDGDDHQLTDLLRLLEQESASAEQRFVIVQEVAKLLQIAGARRRQLLFLTSYVEANPNDPYNAVYLMSVAKAYYDLDSAPLSKHYYERILFNYSDVLIGGNSIHLSALKELVLLETNPNRLVDLHKELIGRFHDVINLGKSYFFLAQAYEALGQWEQAIQAYRAYLQNADTTIPGFPNVRREIIDKVSFYFSDKSWVVRDIEDLVDGIKSAITKRDRVALSRYQSKSSFFSMSWEQQVADENVTRAFDLTEFPLSRVHFEDQLDRDSNTNEAFLRTTGWSHRVKTWYLYFRRVKYKINPDIDGGWEWAGIFLGEKL